jgi:hypothetical protein
VIDENDGVREGRGALDRKRSESCIVDRIDKSNTVRSSWVRGTTSVKTRPTSWPPDAGDPPKRVAKLVGRNFSKVAVIVEATGRIGIERYESICGEHNSDR